MIFFIFGEDSYRSKQKLREIVEGYKKIHKSGLNLIYIDAGEKGFEYLNDSLRTNSMFAEKKLVVVKNVFDDLKFQEGFLGNIQNLKDSKDIVVVYETAAPDQRTKFFKALSKNAKCQEFKYLQNRALRDWVEKEFSAQGANAQGRPASGAGPASGWEKNNAKIDSDALILLIEFVKNDTWRMVSEIIKLSNYKLKSVIKKQDVELLVRPDVENDIFGTIEAVASKNKKLALFLIRKHLDDGDAPVKLISMISYQFKNLLILKELQDKNVPRASAIKKSGLHPFVAQKSYYLCSQFSMFELKKIYRKIFQIDSDIKTGKVDPELAIDLLIAEV